MPCGTRRVDLFAGIGGEQALGRAEAVERAHRHQRTRDRGRGEQPAPVVVGKRTEIAHVFLHRRLTDRGRVDLPAVAQEPGVTTEVAAICGARVLGQAALHCEPRLVLGEQSGEGVGRRLDGSGRHRGSAATPLPVGPLPVGPLPVGPLPVGPVSIGSVSIGRRGERPSAR